MRSVLYSLGLYFARTRWLMQFRGFVGSVPTDLIQTILRIAQPEGWKEVFVACSA